MELEQLIIDEYKKARNKFKPMSSPHHGYAVLLEEFEEVKDDLLTIEQNLQGLWDSVKLDDQSGQDHCIDNMINMSGNLLEEMIQLCAMIRSYREEVIVGMDRLDK